jgi:hypothetical protein
MEQTQDNRLFRWFLRRSTDDTVWVPTVFTNNRERPSPPEPREGALLVFPLLARGTRPSKHFDRTGLRIDDNNVTETEATYRPPPFGCWRPFNLQWPGQLCTRSLRVGVLVSRLHQDQCTNGSVFVFGRTSNKNSRIQLAEAFPARFCLSSK